MEEYVLAAISRGLRRLTFLEHLEEGIKYGQKIWLDEDDFDLYFEEGMRLQELYRNQIDVRLGVECGYNPAAESSILQRLQNRNWDEVGISCHFLHLPGLRSHVNLFSSKASSLAVCEKFDSDHLIELYLTTLLQAIERLPGTKVCHLDGALRFLPGVNLEKSHLPRIDALLAAIKAHSMLLEVNTSGIAIRGEQFPATDILNRAIALEIPLVLGSDAHKPADVGHLFNRFS